MINLQDWNQALFYRCSFLQLLFIDCDDCLGNSEKRDLCLHSSFYNGEGVKAVLLIKEKGTFKGSHGAFKLHPLELLFLSTVLSVKILERSHSIQTRQTLLAKWKILSQLAKQKHVFQLIKLHSCKCMRLSVMKRFFILLQTNVESYSGILWIVFLVRFEWKSRTKFMLMKRK